MIYPWLILLLSFIRSLPDSLCYSPSPVPALTPSATLLHLLPPWLPLLLSFTRILPDSLCYSPSLAPSLTLSATLLHPFLPWIVDFYLYHPFLHWLIHFYIIQAVIDAGNKNRTTHATESNDESSRSHAICQITLYDTSKVTAINTYGGVVGRYYFQLVEQQQYKLIWRY